MNIDLRQVLASRITEAGGRLRVRSALNPALWLCAIVAGPALWATMAHPNPPAWLGWLVAAPVAIACIGYLYLLVFDRDKLQSEEYQIRKKTLELIEHKGMSGPMTVQAIEAIVTPDAYQLPRQKEQD
jgi:hypothetical protein